MQAGRSSVEPEPQPEQDATCGPSDPGTVQATGLVEPARRRVIELAGQVLAGLPTEQIPSRLRAVARFAPSRRNRLAGPAIAATLDGDEHFRTAVAETLGRAMPAVVDALTAGETLVACDPIDVAVTAYLVRPPGWQTVLSAAQGRWADEQARQVASGTSAQLEALRTEVEDLRARLRSGAALTRTQVEEETARLRAELEEARRLLRVRTGELRAAERARDQAVGAALRAAEERDAATDARDGELRRLRGRIADLERAGETARRASRTERELDNARLWLLIDTLTEAAAGLRRELALTPPELRPADTVDARDGQPAPDGAIPRVLTDGASLERLLVLPGVHLIVDGYNVTKTGFCEMALVDQRNRLVAGLSAIVGRTGVEATIAFDGGERLPVQPVTPRGVRVLFSSTGEIADDLIRRLVDAEPRGRPVVVVSSDQEVAVDVRRAGAWSAGSSALLELLS